MNFGGFAGGFAQGFGNGVKIGTTLDAAMKQKKVDEVRAKGVEEARAARESEVAGMVKETGIGPKPVETAKAPASSVVETSALPAPLPSTTPATASPASTTTPTMLPAPDATVTTQPVEQPPAGGQPGMPPDARATTPSATGAATPATSGAATPKNAPPAPVVQPAPGQPTPVATPPAAAGIAPKPFMVGDQGFDTREEAIAHASKKAPPLAEFTGRALAGRMEQHYIESGDVETAEKWGAWAKNKKNEKNMEIWADAYKRSQLGDHAGSARELMKLYPDYNDGMTLTKTEAITDAAGREVGFKMTVRDKAGNEKVIEHDAQTISRMGLQQMTPQKMFEMDRKEQTDAAAARAKAAADAANDRRGLQKEIIVEGVKANTAAKAASVAHERKLEELTIKEQLDDAKIGTSERRKVEAKIDMLKRSGYSEEAVRGLMPTILGIGDHKKTTDPQERRALILSDMIKGDPRFAKKSLAEQNAEVDKAMEVIHGPSGSAPSPGQSPAKAPPAAAGIGKPPAAAAPPKGVPYLTPDGKVVYR